MIAINMISIIVEYNCMTLLFAIVILRSKKYRADEISEDAGTERPAFNSQNVKQTK